MTVTVIPSCFSMCIEQQHPQPSTPGNNARGDRNSGDTLVSDRFQQRGRTIPFLVGRRNGLTMYDPKTQTSDGVYVRTSTGQSHANENSSHDFATPWAVRALGAMLTLTLLACSVKAQSGVTLQDAQTKTYPVVGEERTTVSWIYFSHEMCLLLADRSGQLVFGSSQVLSRSRKS
jgi:hypothetical protein